MKNVRKLVVGISSRALFDLGESHAIYESRGLQAYSEYQMEHENEYLKALARRQWHPGLLPVEMSVRTGGLN